MWFDNNYKLCYGSKIKSAPDDWQAIQVCIEIGLYDQNKYVSKYSGQAKNDLKATKLNKKSIHFVYCKKNKIKFGGKSNAFFFEIYNKKNPKSVLTLT